jgi:hypothetical protein
MAPSRAVVVREGDETSKGYAPAGLWGLVFSLSGLLTSSYQAEGKIVGGVFASRRRTPRGREPVHGGISGCENREIPRPPPELWVGEPRGEEPRP